MRKGKNRGKKRPKSSLRALHPSFWVCRRRPPGVQSAAPFSVAKERARGSSSLRCFLLQPRAGRECLRVLSKGANAGQERQREEALGEEKKRRKKASSFSRRPSWPRRTRGKAEMTPSFLAGGCPCVVLHPLRDQGVHGKHHRQRGSKGAGSALAHKGEGGCKKASPDSIKRKKKREKSNGLAEERNPLSFSSSAVVSRWNVNAAERAMTAAAVAVSPQNVP